MTPLCARSTVMRSRCEGWFLESRSARRCRGVSAFAEPDHWHLVSYGLTELFGKESDVVEISGFG